MSVPQVNHVPLFCNERFLQRFNQFSEIGKLDSGAVNRPFGSAADVAARSWICDVARSIGLSVRIDAIGNIWGIRAGEKNRSAIALGSHHDSVPNGGRFDGALGILVALEVIQSLADFGYQNAHPLHFVSFTAEEPNPFDLSTMGSRTVAGRLSRDKLGDACDWGGRKLTDALSHVGGGLERFSDVRKTAADIAVFMELHIEQGRHLERAGIPIGVVSTICGIYRETVTVAGEANHAGTTELPDRRDALLAASEMLLGIERLLKECDQTGLIATVGRMAISPNAVNIIPAACEFSLEIRGQRAEQIYDFRDRCASVMSNVARRRGVSVTHSIALNQAPQAMSPDVMNVMRTSAQALHIPYATLPSMAGHDATHIASFTRAGMIFVPSLGGKSHCKEEESRLDDIEQAFYVMAASVMALDHALH